LRKCQRLWKPTNTITGLGTSLGTSLELVLKLVFEITTEMESIHFLTELSESC